MNIDISDLDLDRERYNKAQEIVTLVNDLLRTENRPDPVYTTVRRDLLDVMDHLRRVLWTYNIMIKGHDKEMDRSV